MKNAMAFIPDETAGATEAETASRGPQKPRPGFGCVYLTSSAREAERASALVDAANIRIYHADRLEEAEARLRLTRSRVLLTETAFQRGSWIDALEVSVRLAPPVALVVAARLTDERLWIGVLERGAYDLIQKPFRADELRRILANAHSHAIAGSPLHMTA